MVKAVSTIIDSDDFKISSSEAKKCIETASQVLAWSKHHSSAFTRFSTSLFCMLSACFNSKSHSLPIIQESIWERFHELRTSALFFRKWEEFLSSSVSEPAIPAFIQYVSRKVLEELMKQGFQFNHSPLQSGESSTTTVISSIECDALKYVAGYVCRKVCTQIKSSTINGKDSMVQFLSNFRTDDDSDEDDVEDDWIHRIDRGGLWHVGETMYMVFYIMEEEIRHHFTLELLPENEERKKKILSALYSNVDLQQQWERLAMDYLDEKEKSHLLNQIIRLYVTVRGFAFANSCLELYKQRHTKKLQKSKSLRRELITD